ncbi:hypothetical protein ACFYXM_31465 [Streptomyces sp. NPDC002476]|uniref:hypothetical protein n=1 Tax=Streptomyces sp. NPDC002476 TaxID=3364648 RepID=UPI0036A438A3
MVIVPACGLPEVAMTSLAEMAAASGKPAYAEGVMPEAVAAAPAEIVAPNARAAAEVDFRGELLRQENVVDSLQVGEGLYCAIVDPNAGINLSNALILANGGPQTSSVSTIGRPTPSCDSRRDAVTVVTLKDGHPESSSFTIAVL